MKKFIFFSLLFSSFCMGQVSEHDQIKASVEMLFTAMKNSDPEQIKSVFTHNAVLESVAKDGTVKSEKIEDFIASISKFSKDDLDERIHFASIQTDGNLASVFTPYEFYFKGKFSHCGANSFQLIKQNDLWKIQYLIDTRRKENCKK